MKRNWKTKFCEVDIVSQKNGVAYFTEVKHRKNANAGGGIAAITPKKLKQMKFAAELYAANKKIIGKDILLAVAITTGNPILVTDFIELKE